MSLLVTNDIVWSMYIKYIHLICDMHGDTFSFDLIGISEAFRCNLISRLSLPGFHELITRCRDDGAEVELDFLSRMTLI